MHITETEIIFTKEDLERKDPSAGGNVYLFLIDDPTIKFSVKELEDGFSIRFQSDFWAKEKVAYIVEMGKKEEYAPRESDKYTEIFLEKGKLDTCSYFRRIGYMDTSLEEKKITYNGTFYKITDLADLT